MNPKVPTGSCTKPRYNLPVQKIKKLADWMSEHYIALLFALIAGSLTVLPHMLAVHALGTEYHGVPFLMIDNEDYYLARVQEIVDGHGFVGSSFFLEYKNVLPVVPSIGEYLYVALALVTHLAIPETLVLAKFLFPFFLFLLIYIFIQNVSGQNNEGEKNYWGAIAGAAIIVMGYDLVNYHLVYERLIGVAHTARVLSPWSRPVNPITGALFLFIYLNFLWVAWIKPSRAFVVLSGLAITLSLGYVFTVGIELAVLGVLIVLSLLWKEYLLTKRLLAVGAIGLGLASIYWINVLRTLTSGSDLAGKNGLMLMHTPLPNKVLLAVSALVIVMIIIARKYNNVHVWKERTQYMHVWFVFALLLGGFMVLNQQILTGRTIWPYHFVQYTNPIAILSLFIIGFTLIRPHVKNMWNVFVGISIVMSIAMAIWSATTYKYGIDEFRALQNNAPLFAWLNENAKKDCVVLTVDDDQEVLTGFIPGFTSCNVYGTKNFVSATIPHERLVHNFFILLRMRGVTDATVDAYLTRHRELVLRYFYKDYQELFELVHNDRIDKLTPSIASEYKAFYKVDLGKEISQYQVDYIVAKNELPEKVAQALALHINPVFESGSTTLYTFK